MSHDSAQLRLDHLAIACADLGVGVRRVEELLGVAMAPGGRHTRFATHNRLLSLGPETYLEVIAPDPDAAPPDGPRWFGLDAAPAVPRLANWIVAADDLACLPVGPVVAMSRGALRWELTVPQDGGLPEGGGLPTLIRWPAGVHPAAGLPDHGLRLRALEVHHPDADRLAAMVLPLLGAAPVTWHPADAPALRARIDGPRGAFWLD